ncbi:MAG: efflux RND transporter periplasmic adaptor subunit, partial [Gammaproteobacteria bacterium]|nr:efflux RND transporter periplasmic adaptor subunit [Gammaproteobacteria bacterium]
ARADEVHKAKADMEIAQGNLQTAEENKNIAGLEYQRILAQIEQRTLRSPVDGVVIEVHKQAGELITSSESELLTIARLDKLRVVTYLPESAAAGLQEGGQTQILLPAGNLHVGAQVEHISPIVDAKSGTVKVTLLLDNAANRLRSGWRAVLRLEEGIQPSGTRLGDVGAAGQVAR